MNSSYPLLFLNFSNPSEEARKKSHRQQIRSWVTKRQHFSRNEAHRIANAAELLRSRSPRSAEAGTLSNTKVFQQSPHQLVSPTCLMRKEPRRAPLALSWRISNVRRDDRQDVDHVSNATGQQRECTALPQSGHTETDTKGEEYVICPEEDSIRLQYSLEDPVDVLNKSCKQVGQSMTDSLHLLSNLIHALGPDLEHKLQIQQGLTAKYMLPMVLSDPALLAATTLKCVTMICHLQGICARPVVLLEVRQFALARIREALEDPDSERALADTLLCAVSTLANYELVYNGDRELYHAHKTGLVKMIALRGGLEKLGHEGYTQSTLLYNDANTAKLAGCSPHLSVFRRFDSDVDPEFWLQGVDMPEEEGAGSDEHVDGCDELEPYDCEAHVASNEQ